MSDTTPELDLVVAEHRHLNELFSRLEVILSSEKVDLPQLTKLLGELRDDVLQHFTHEEQGGFFEKIAEKEPRLEPEAKLLKEQHQMMRNLLSQIVNLISKSEVSASELKEACRDLREFKDYFEAHEEDENRLLQEAYDRDVGSKD